MTKANEDMNIQDLLGSAQGQALVQQLSSQMGISGSEATTAITHAMPTILAGLGNNAKSSAGAAALNTALDRHDGNLLDNLGSAFQNAQALEQDGNGILGHVFGNQLSGVQQGLSKQTGLNMSKIGPILAALAPVAMAYVGKQRRQTNTQQDGLGGLLGNIVQGATQSSGVGGEVLGNILGGILGGR